MKKLLVLGSVFVVAALLAIGAARAKPLGFGSAAPRSTGAASPATWKPWLLSSASQFRLAPPPLAKSSQTKAELAQLLRLQKTRASAAVQAVMKKWTGQPAVIPWVELELRLLQDYRPRVAPACRALALLGVAMYEAAVAADDSRLAYAKSSRPAPWLLDKRLKPAVRTAAGSSYAPIDAAIAGAAEKVLAYLYPGEPKRTFTQLANEALAARLDAGLNYRSDVQQARAIGQKVATLVIARGESDNYTATGFSEGPFTGEQFWVTTPPSYEGATGAAVGLWKPWLISGPQQFASTIPPPSAYGSPAFMAQLNEVFDVQAHLTDTQRQIANFWDDGPGSLTPPGHWTQITAQLVKTYKLSETQAIRAFAYQGVSVHDAVISWFWLKYHYWQIRPITAIWRLAADGKLLTQAQCNTNPSLCPNRDKWYPIITTPPFPAYPAGHPTLSGISAKVLTYFFPKANDTLNQLAQQVADSRVYGGIHYREDVQEALVLGRAVGDAVLARARGDGGG